MAVVTLTTGVPGCGKTYVRASRYIVDYFLLETTGHYYTNFPLNVDAICEEVASRQRRNTFFSRLFGRRVINHTAEYYKSRLHIIPDFVLQSWRSEESGPWDLFRNVDLVDAHIAIDEIHNFCSDSKSSDYMKKWDEFLGEVRHRGCTFEGITQDISAVHSCFTGRASTRLELIPCEDLRDPYFGIVMLDWYNLKASFTGSFHKTVFEVEKRKNGSGRWVKNHTRRFLIIPEYFRFYNSYEASLQEKQDGVTESDRAPKYEYQRRSRISLVFWFIRKNFFSLFSRLGLLILFFWLCFGGGIVFLINGFLSYSNGIASSNSVKSSTINNEAKNDDSSSAVSASSPDPFQRFYESDLSSFLPAFVDRKNNIIVLRNGCKIYKDYTFERGSAFEGLTVSDVDFSNRCYTLSNGFILRMRFIKPVRPVEKEKNTGKQL